MNYNDQIIDRVIEAYCKATDNTEFTKDDAIAWAIQNGTWKPSLKSQVELLRGELDVALRAKKKAHKGRKIRQYNCIRRKLSDGYVQTVWAHIDVATETFMEQSVAEQRKGIAGVVFSLHNTITYWKEKNPDSQIEVEFNFNNDNADKDAAIAIGLNAEDEELLFDEAQIEEAV